MAQITGVSAIRRALRRHAESLGLDKDMNPSVVVGYTANYALFVHENITMSWRGLPRLPRPPHIGNYWDGSRGPGQSKFLEQPFREHKEEIIRIVNTAVERGATFLQALYLAGLRIQRESQLLVPVDTGNLKASAFTRKE